MLTCPFYYFQTEVEDYLIICYPKVYCWKAYKIAAMTSLNDLPGEILMKIMMDLRYRDVKAVGKTCQRLSDICETILESKQKAVEIRAVWRNQKYHPSLEHMLSAASLARHGFLTEVKFMVIFPDPGILDLSSIPIVDLQKLSKCVSDGVRIRTCDGDLSPVLANINCNWVQLSSHYEGKSSLTTAETQALVTAMVSGVKTVRMDKIGDLEVLAQYDGKGKCDCIELEHHRVRDGPTDNWRYVNTEYGDKMEEWALRVGWQITRREEEQLVSDTSISKWSLEKYSGLDMILRRR